MAGLPLSQAVPGLMEGAVTVPSLCADCSKGCGENSQMCLAAGAVCVTSVVQVVLAASRGINTSPG